MDFEFGIAKHNIEFKLFAGFKISASAKGKLTGKAVQDQAGLKITVDTFDAELKVQAVAGVKVFFRLENVGKFAAGAGAYGHVGVPIKFVKSMEVSIAPGQAILVKNPAIEVGAMTGEFGLFYTKKNKLEHVKLWPE